MFHAQHWLPIPYEAIGLMTSKEKERLELNTEIAGLEHILSKAPKDEWCMKKLEEAKEKLRQLEKSEH